MSNEQDGRLAQNVDDVIDIWESVLDRVSPLPENKRPLWREAAREAITPVARLTDEERAQRNDPGWLESMAWWRAHRAETMSKEAARDVGASKGYAFRAAELRYDARGGMTEALARRRFEPGARWSIDGEECAVVCRDESGLRLDSDRWTDGMFVLAADMTRENGWLFLDLGTGSCS